MDNSLLFAVTIAIGTVIVIITLVVNLRRKFDVKKSNPSTNNYPLPAATDLVVVDVNAQEGGMNIWIEQLPTTALIPERHLFEITDRTILARISETIPAAVQLAAKAASDVALQRTEMYRVILPSHETLVKSKDVLGAVRGFSRNAKGVQSHANLVKVDSSKISKTSTVASGVASVMNVASLVVGQYYMSVIDSKLDSMTKSLDKIGDFQDQEFKARILSLITRTGEISQFSSEIMENDEQRIIKLTTLEDLKGIAIDLIGQTNITIVDNATRSLDLDYRGYQKNVIDFTTLIEYQNILTAILEEISKLTYLLGKGGISIELSYSLFKKSLAQSAHVRNVLLQWHDKQVKVLGIDLRRERISKKGFEAFLSLIPGLVNDDRKYKGLEEGLADMISIQTKTEAETAAEQKAVYAEDVQIIIKDDKYYYLHEVHDLSAATDD